jgi:hypothetical protein
MDDGYYVGQFMRQGGVAATERSIHSVQLGEFVAIRSKLVFVGNKYQSVSSALSSHDAQASAELADNANEGGADEESHETDEQDNWQSFAFCS